MAKYFTLYTKWLNALTNTYAVEKLFLSVWVNPFVNLFTYLTTYISFSFQDEPMTGEREITPRTWRGTRPYRPRTGTVKVKTVDEDDEVEEQDRLGLEEATQRDDDEFQPSLTHQEDDDDDDIEEVEDEEEMDDEDWDIKRGGE